MKKLLLLLKISLFWTNLLPGQIVKGIVLESKTDNVIPYANVYVNGSNIGTTTDIDGYFQLSMEQLNNRPIVISAIGYVSHILSNYPPDENIQIYLEPSLTMLDEIVIKPDHFPREKKVKMFKKLFLGTTTNASKCFIKNINDIQLVYDGDTLRAYSENPIRIHNTALNYKITYYLSTFENSSDRLFYQGNYFFRHQDSLLSSSEQEKINRKRERAYLGSEMHFFRALWANELEKERFQIIGKDFKELTYQDIVCQENEIKYLCTSQEYITVIFQGAERSILTILKDKILFDRDGYFEPHGIQWSGSMTAKRIGDLLPFEYTFVGSRKKRTNKPKKAKEIQDIVLTDFGSDFVGKLKNRLEIFKDHFNQEKVYLHFDKPYYAPGETMWFSVYLVNAFSLKSQTPSNLVHVQLIGPKRNIIEEKVIKIEGISGKGEFQLVDSLRNNLRSGNYLVRAYTNFQRNFGPPYFTRNFHLLPATNYQEISDSTYSSDPQSSLLAHDSIMLQFFPEGGDLVNGLRSTVGFKAVNSWGKGVDVSGAIYDDQGKLQTNFDSFNLGIGAFTFTPQAERSYHALIKVNGKPKRYTFPRAQDQGYILNINNLSANNTHIHLQSNTLNGLNGATIIGQIRGGIFFHTTINENKKEINFRLPKAGFLFDGVAQVTLFDPNGIPRCERLIFLEAEEQIQFNITSDKNTYTPRSPVIINLNNIQIKATLSVSVTDLGLVTVDSLADNIKTNLLLTSDVRGYVEKPGYYFAGNDPRRKRALDYLLLTQGWRRFHWEKLATDQFHTIDYLPEQGFNISGVLMSSFNDDKTISGNVTMAVLPDVFSAQKITTDESGKFVFSGYDFPDTTNIILQAERVLRKKTKKPSKTDKNVKIILDQPHSPPVDQHISVMPPVHGFRTLLISQYLKKHTKIRSLDPSFAMDANTVLLKGVTVEATKENPFQKYGAIYGEPSNRLVMDSLGTLGLGPGNVLEMLKGRVAGVQVIGGKVSIRGSAETLSSADTAPLFLLNNMPVIQDIITQIPLNFIHHVEVLKGPRTAIFGSRGANGVIAVFTKTGADVLGPEKELTNILNFSHPGYHKAREFYSPNYDEKDTDIIKNDHRITLYWNPSVKTEVGKKSKIKFFTSDDVSTYRIEVEGILENGKVVRLQHLIKVEN